MLISLGVERTGEVLARLSDRDVEEVSTEIARVENVSPGVVMQVLGEYQEMHLAEQYVAQGGLEFARQALETALGHERAEEILVRIEAATQESGFHQLQAADTEQLAGFLRREHPQTAALIFAHLHPRKSAEVLDEMDDELQGEVVFRLANMDKTSPEFIHDVEEVLRDRIDVVLGSNLHETGGAEVTAMILNAASRGVERRVLSEIQDRDRRLADRIKDIMFVFDDLVHLEDRDLQTLLMEVEQDDLALALKAAGTDLEQKIYRNLSSRVQEMVREEVELLGRVRVADVDEAQNNIMEIARELEAEEEITMTAEKTSYIE